VDAACIATGISIQLGRTSLERSALAAAAVGDAVVFETAAVARHGPWPVEVRFGDCLLPAALDVDGSLRKTERLRCHESEVPMTTEREHDTEPLPAETMRALAAAPVEIVAELGRLTVRGDELAGLLEGGVLSLGPRRPAAVRLCVGGRL